jgi:hypothetical protein
MLRLCPVCLRISGIVGEFASMIVQPERAGWIIDIRA